jgi:hypothetical protein
MNRERFKLLFPRASQDTIRANTDEIDPHLRLQNAELERDQAAALGVATERKTKSVQRVTVRFVGYRCRPLDPDNFAGGCKDLLDGLRHAGLLPDDRPEDIIFETEQIKVAHRGEERTQIILEYL